MQIATNVSKRITVNVPDNIAYLEGQVCGNNRTGALLAVSSAGPSSVAANQVVQGVAMVDVPVKQNYTPGSTSVPMNSPRATPFATEGLVAIRVQDQAQYNALALDSTFGILNGNAVTLGTGGTGVASSNGWSYLYIREKYILNGSYYIVVDLNG